MTTTLHFSSFLVFLSAIGIAIKASTGVGWTGVVTLVISAIFFVQARRGLTAFFVAQVGVWWFFGGGWQVLPLLGAMGCTWAWHKKSHRMGGLMSAGLAMASGWLAVDTV